MSGASSGLPLRPLKLKELWMLVVLCDLVPSFQHIRNSYTGAERQDAATLI